MGAPLTLALRAGETPLAPASSEPWVNPQDLAGGSFADTVDLESVCTVATEILFLLSGRRYGVRTETTRPYAGEHVCGWGYLAASVGGDLAVDGDWRWRYQRNEGAPDWLLLKSPVQSVLTVKVDGVTLAPEEYLLYDNRKLVRAPGANGSAVTWPIFQRLDLDDTDEGTFSITYQWGRSVPAGARLAAQVFATELAKYVNKDSDCALPDRLVSVTRQGVTQTLMDPSQFIKEARTGLYLVDTWLGAVNPNGNRRRPVVLSPDSAQLVRPT